MDNFNSLKKQYLAKLAVIKKDFTQLLEQDKVSPEDINKTCNIVHQLAGNGATFGYPKISSSANIFEQYLDNIDNHDIYYDDHGENFKTQLTDFLSSLDQVISVASLEFIQVNRSELAFSSTAEHIYLLEDDIELAGYIAGELLLDNYYVDLFGSVTEINEAIKTVKPSAIIADIVLPEGPEAGIDWVNTFNSSIKPPIPVIFISERGDFDVRLNAVRSGADYYLKKPINIKQLKDALHECVYQRPYEPYRVMIIDDDRLLSDVFMLEMINRDINVNIVSEARQAIREIERFKPELILLDLHMPDCDGIELGQIIRQWPEYASIPIVFMSVERNFRKQLDAIRVAGDDFLVKPIEPWQLSIHVLARVKRARIINSYQEELVSKVAHQKLHDQLTGLPNRTYLELKTNEAVDLANRSDSTLAALLWMDIDNFSHLNDVLGHDIGDQIIIDVGNRLSEALNNKSFLCRLGGDEYAIVMSQVKNRSEVKKHCKEIMSIFKDSFKIDGESLRLTMSMGVGIYQKDHIKNSHQLIKAADIALYHAKLNGRNNYMFFTPSMEQQLSRNLWMESELRRSFSRNELSLHYQPKYSIDGKTMIGAEALLRWSHPKLGMVSPTEFIPLAEKTALITDIAYWVLKTCCEQINTWEKNGINVPPIAINLSPRELENPKFLKTLIEAPSNFGFDPKTLQIELTERTVAKQDSFIIDALKRLSDSGLQIAIDDFGTGYSSLKNLQEMPISLLKIDGSFILDIPDNKDNCHITNTIVRLGKKMSVDVLAEGVETENQVNFLKKIGCKYIQGYIYSRPLEADKFLELINA